MPKLVDEKQSATDPLVACCEAVLEFHQRRTDLAGLRAELTMAEGSRTIAPIMNLHSVIARRTQSRDCLRTIDELFASTVDKSVSSVLPNRPLSRAVTLSDFGYTYPEQSRAAVKSVNLTIKAGEHLCLIGPSGAGKSTLARAMAGALVSQQGNISI